MSAPFVRSPVRNRRQVAPAATLAEGLLPLVLPLLLHASCWSSADSGTVGTGGGPGSGGAGAGTGGVAGGGGGGAPGGTGGGGGTTATAQGPLGWASVNAANQNGTTGGGDAAPLVVTTVAELASAADLSTARVIRISGAFGGSVSVGDNKTIEGLPGAVFQGNLRMDGSVNIIVRNLKIVGNNCSDGGCGSAGEDAVTINGGAHHIWIDHCDISDGSDGNLDITEGADYVTVSWTRFSYSSASRDHRFSNLVGGGDGATGDAGHLKVTFHNNWWDQNVVERQPRVRFGQVHVFNNLYTSTASSYAVGVGVNANILTENNAFIGVRNPINSLDYSNDASVVVAHGNVYQGSQGMTADKGTGVFTPPYAYVLDDAAAVQTEVMAGAGPPR
jgi:pectate lyase